MLIELRFRNIFSFKETTSFLMTRVKSFKERLDTNIIQTDRDFDLLKAAAVYGSNASGKSNFLRVINVMSLIIRHSFSESLKKDSERVNYNFPFKLNAVSEKSNTMFEVSFIQNEVIYRYGFEIFQNEIKEEWLYRKQDREILLFSRKDQSFDINHESFPEGLKYKDEVNTNVLLLSHLAQYNQKTSREVLHWFNEVNVINCLQEKRYQEFTASLLRNDTSFKKWASSVLKYLEIVTIDAGEGDGEIITFHNKYDENDLLIGAIPFKPEWESDGTKKLIDILGPIYDTLRNGGILFIDEFDSKLHPNLTKKLVGFFQDFNLRNAQFIFSCQDTNILNKDILRRDQIWFVEKDQFGASQLYSLSEFNANTVRNSSAYDKKYLDNIFGAADTLDITSKMTDLLYAS